MMVEGSSTATAADDAARRAVRARRHAALGDEHRLAIVDALRLGDRTPGELRVLTDLPSNLLAFHLDVLEAAALVARRRSQGDGRRRYVTLDHASLDELATADRIGPPTTEGAGPVVFVCTRNAARSQLAAALWHDRTGGRAVSAGTHPAAEPDPHAVAVAVEHGLRVDDWAPRGYDDVDDDPALVVSVCDRARESGIPWSAPHLHWSVEDPHGRQASAYRATLRAIDGRVRRLATALGIRRAGPPPARDDATGAPGVPA